MASFESNDSRATATSIIDRSLVVFKDLTKLLNNVSESVSICTLRLRSSLCSASWAFQEPMSTALDSLSISDPSIDRATRSVFKLPYYMRFPGPLKSVRIATNPILDERSSLVASEPSQNITIFKHLKTRVILLSFNFLNSYFLMHNNLLTLWSFNCNTPKRNGGVFLGLATKVSVTCFDCFANRLFLQTMQSRT